jgi:hypothetical protein
MSPSLLRVREKYDLKPGPTNFLAVLFNNGEIEINTAG